MSEVFLLDTNAVISIFSGNEDLITLLDKVEEAGGEFRYSAMTAGEIAAGLHHYEETEVIEDFLTETEFEEVTSTLMIRAGRLRSNRIKWGVKSVKLPDAIILATALDNNWTLVSNDAHMELIEELGGKLKKFVL
ncbi:type II toxin-antitoxin system VapC family toxin [Saccharibacillus sacchari]|uniref:PIN domain-containing protein n=1 Tax=Saccharibacillus sacchari TaxID=456493 RepID=A0ACC6PBL2_9BACL